MRALAGVALIAFLAQPAVPPQQAFAQEPAQPSEDRAAAAKRSAKVARPTPDTAANTKTNGDGAIGAQGDEQPTLLDQITAVSRTREAAIDSMASVSHVDGAAIERRMASSPQGLLFGVPGIALQADGNRTSSSVNIRGLQDFGRVATIVDGARQNFQRSGHGAQTMFWLDPELVQQVDVVRGPTANTFGSGAIGGVVYYETKDAGDVLRPDETWASLLTARYDTNGKGWTTSATGAGRLDENVDVLGNIVYRDFGDYKDGDRETVSGTGFDILSGMTKANIRPSDNSELKLGWVGASDSWTEGQDAYDMDMHQNTYTARYSIANDDGLVDLHINAAYGKTDLRQTFLRDVAQFNPVTAQPIVVRAGSSTSYDLETASLDLWNTSRFSTGVLAHELTYGGDIAKDDVVTTAAAGGADVYTPSGKRLVSGAYLQDKMTYGIFEAVTALRYDHYRLSGEGRETSEGDRLSPRITLGVSPFSGVLEGLQLYGSYAEGYRSPSVTETMISGFHPSGVAFPFLPNPNLKPETARTWEGGLNYKADSLIEGGDALRLKAAYFDNDVDDYIGGTTLSAFPTNAACPYTPGTLPICYQYQNFAKARLRGLEVEGFYEASWGYAGLSASVINGHTVSYTGLRADLTTVPSRQVTGQVGLRFLEDRLTVGAEVQYNGAPKGNKAAEDYTLVNTFASYKVADDFKLDLRVDNLFNKTYANPLNATTTSALYEPGLTVKISATKRFGG
ncbi:ligand-gated channel [Xaviernesmea oryzae]|uniref:Ligand-gated channel n=2 Tax=Xaviernesmea oryzae TaxID=464029 RepID=A0A1Q9ARF8_9HYPH|nr:ligand-gated channel [Xaviernesmea oryzae]